MERCDSIEDIPRQSLAHASSGLASPGALHLVLRAEEASSTPCLACHSLIDRRAQSLRYTRRHFLALSTLGTAVWGNKDPSNTARHRIKMAGTGDNLHCFSGPDGLLQAIDCYC